MFFVSLQQNNAECPIFLDWIKAAEAFETIALFTFLGAIATAAIYAFVPDFEGDMRILGATMGLIGATGQLNRFIG